MSERVTMLQDQQLKQELTEIEWPLEDGTVKVQIRDGKPAQVTIERTIG